MLPVSKSSNTHIRDPGEHFLFSLLPAAQTYARLTRGLRPYEDHGFAPFAGLPCGNPLGTSEHSLFCPYRQIGPTADSGTFGAQAF